ncbi:MAG: hypothetical protein FJ395_19315 [Verrucomicrobia bacterium]|nr:hypothetical protein [Verrucomicrobiota bacterium]
MAELERLSAFDRPSGGQLLPVIHAHRILTIGSDQYHVLSCIQDAGPDYSGRTNHIAHHLICEERELQRAASPAMILRVFPWRKCWKEPARYFDESEEVDLTQFRVPPTSSAWMAVTGYASHARLLTDAQTRRGCTVVYVPGGDDQLLRLFHESLESMDPSGRRAESLWQVPFTTFLQATDRQQDFGWRGCWSGSAGQRSAVSGGELIFDLTRPDTLPAPPPLPRTQPPPKQGSVSVTVQDNRPSRRARVVSQPVSTSSPASKGVPLVWLIPVVSGMILIAVVAFFIGRRPRNVGQEKSKTVPASTAVSNTIPVTSNNAAPVPDRAPVIPSPKSTQQPPQTAPTGAATRSPPTKPLPKQNPLANAAPLELDQLPNVPTYLVFATREGGVNLGQVFARHGMKTPKSCAFLCTPKPFPSFPNFSFEKTNTWADGKLYEGATKKIFVMYEDNALQHKDGDFSIAAIHFIGTNSFNLLYWESSKPWLEPVTLSKTNLSRGVDHEYADYGMSDALRHRLQQFRPGSSNSHPILFRLYADCLTNVAVKYQQPSMYTNGWNRPSNFNDRFSPRTTEEAISREKRSLESRKKGAENDAKRNAKSRNPLLTIPNLESPGESLLKKWNVTPREGNGKFSDFVKVKEKGEDYNPTWSDYCEYLKGILTRLKEQEFSEPDDDNKVAKKNWKERICPKWDTIFALLNTATKNPTTAGDKLEKELPDVLNTLDSKHDYGKAWKDRFGAGQLKTAVDKLSDSNPQSQLAEFDQQMDELDRQMKSLPKPDQTFGRIQLEIQVDGAHWWPLIIFTDEKGKK